MTKEEILGQHLKINNSGFDIELMQATHYRTLKAILNAMEQYANQRALEVAGEAWDAGYNRARDLHSDCIKSKQPDRDTYLNSLKL